MTFRQAALCFLVAMLGACADPTEESLLAAARLQLDKRQLPAAVIEIKRVLAENPNSAAGRLLLGRVLLEMSDPAAAEVELRKAFELGAKEDEVVPNLAKALLLVAQPAKVVAQFGSTTLKDPSAQAELKTWLAAAHAQQGNRDRANAELDAALLARPQFPAAMMVRARMMATAGDVDGALRVLDSALAAEPDNEQVGVAKGYLLWIGRADAEGALAVHRRVLTAHPNNVPAAAEVVTILFRQGKVDQARQQFEQLKKTAPNHPETLFFDAQFAVIDRDFKRARDQTDLLLKAVPDHVRALELSAAIEFQDGNDLQAQAQVARALKVAPGLKLARQILAQSFLRTDQPAKALETLVPLLQDQGDAQSLAIAGAAHLQMGNLAKADAAFKRASQKADNSATLRTNLAVAMLAGGSNALALRELEKIAVEDKGTRADMALISAKVSAKDFPGALKAVDALEGKQTSPSLSHQLRGQVLLAMRDTTGARRSFDAALAKDNKYFPAVAALAAMDVAEAKTAVARERLTGFLGRVPGHAQASLLLADLPEPTGAPAADAVARLQQAARMNPRNAKAHLALIGHHLRLSDRAGALNAAQAAAAAMPEDPSIIQALGQAQLLAGDSLQAKVSFRRLTVIQPGNAQFHMNLAEAELASKDTGAATRSLEKAAKLDPKLGEARRSLAILALRANRVSEALDIARDMQKQQPKDPLGWDVEGDIRSAQKDWAAAATAFRGALSRSNATEAAIKLHAVLSAAGNAADAERVAADWERVRPKDPAFLFYLGDVATQKQQFAVAEGHYRAVLDRQPGNALAMNNLAWLMLQQSKPGALEMAEKANLTLPNRAPILDTLATIQAASGQLKEAVATQQKAVAAAPGDPGLKLALARHMVKAGMKSAARQELDSLERLGPAFGRQDEVAQLKRTL